MNEIEPKKMVRRNVALALGIICVVVIASMVSVVTLLLNNSNLSQKYDKEYALAKSWEDSTIIPNNIDNLFQNKSVLWNNKVVTEPMRSDASADFVFTNFFNFTGGLLINVTSSTAASGNWVAVSWNTSRVPVLDEFQDISFWRSVTSTNIGLFPVLPTTSLKVYIGNEDDHGPGNETQTVTITYYY